MRTLSKKTKAKVVSDPRLLHFRLSTQHHFLQHGIGQSSIGQGKSQQASVADVQDAAVAQQSALDELANENAMPAESRTAALSAITLFFMMRKFSLSF